MRRFLLNLMLLFCFGIANSQTVFNPNDAVITWNSGAPLGSASNPYTPGGYDIRPWVRTPRMAWNTDRYKCYIIGNIPFRLRYPNSYVPGANDGKKYPVVLFFHGGGEATTEIHDNEFQLFNGGYTFQDKILYGPQDAFVLFPQSKYVSWDDSYYTPMNVVIDELVRNCKADPDRVISMGLSIGGYASLDYAVRYPQRASTVIASSPVYAQSFNYAPAIHVPLWVSSGGNDNNPDPVTFQNFINYYRPTGGSLFWSFFPAQYHTTWDWQWAEEPNFGNTWATAHKANPMIYFNNRFFCPGTPVSSRMGITGGFYAYQWDKNGVLLPGATGNEYIATDFGTYRARFKRTAASDWSAWSLAPAVISPTCPPLTGNGTGLNAFYYNNVDLAGNAYNRVDGNMNWIWEATTPAPGINNSFYSVRWIGKIQSQFSETYTIYTKSDEGIRLWINGVQLINNYVDHAPTENSASFTFVAGQKYDIKIEYYNKTAGGQAILKWSSPSTVKQVVPKTQLYPDGTGSPDGSIFCTSNLAPANNAVLSTNLATLAWAAAANATSYDIYLWTGATPPATPTANTASTSYNATGLTPGAVYNWYVVPKNATTSATGCSTTGRTSFSVSGTIPGCAVNTSPAEASTVATQTTANLSWNTAANATSYDVYLWTGATAPGSPTANVTGTTYAATGLTASTLYNWYVIPKNASGSASGCAATNKSTFTTAAVAAPACVVNATPVNGSTVTAPTTASLTWGTAANATSYDVYVWTGATPPATATANVTTNAYNATGLNASTVYNWYVVPKNSTGAATGCSSSATNFTTAVPAPNCVANTSPANNAVLATANTATLSWTSAPTATSYDVYVWTGATVPSTPTANTAATSYNATGLTAGSSYNWYVAPKNASGTATGCGTSNKSVFVTAPPPAPLCVSNVLPANASTIGTPNTATLNWNAEINASSYDVYLSPGNGTPTTLVGNSTTNSYNATGLTALSTYSWYVVPKNITGTATGCASNFTVFNTSAAVPPCVVNTSPANSTILPSQTSVRLNWSAAAGAVSYDVYLAAGNAVPTLLVANTTDRNYYASGLTAGTLYSWYVAPRNANGANTACGVSNRTTFTTAAATGGANQAPIANAGANVAITLPVTSVTLNGGASYDPDGRITEFYWYQSQGPATTSLNNFLVSPTITGLTVAGTYSFGLQVKDNSGVNSYGGVTVTVNAAGTTTIPACVSNSSPGSGSNIATATTASLAWTAAAGAASYDVYIWTGLTPPASPTANTSSTSYTASGLTAATAYNWYIAPRNSAGVATGCISNSTSFTTAQNTAPPACTVNVSPVNNAVLGTATTATLSWNTVAAASSYDVYLWSGATAPASPTANVSTASFSATGLTASTSYNWYVVPRNASGAATGCSSNSSSFTTAARPVPLCTSNTSPANNAVLTTATAATLTWNVAATATSYDVYLWTGATPPTSPTTNVNTTTYNATGLAGSSSYSWYIVPKNAGGSATGCAATGTTAFTTAAVVIPVPPCATNTAPLNAATLATQTTAGLTWSSVASATSYDVYIWTGATAPATPVANVTAASYNATGLLAGTLYNWYVSPKNAGGNATGCDATNKSTFTTAPLPVPACVSNTTPLNGASIATQTTASLSWGVAAIATSYDVYIWSGPTPPALPTANVSGTSYVANNLNASTLYNWYVAPRNASGPANGCASNATVFTTAAIVVPLPGCTSNTLPADGSTIATSTTASLSWAAAANATMYDVYLWTGATQPSTPVATVTGTSYDASGLAAASLYNWYVVPKNTGGAATGCATASKTSFTTGAIATPSCTSNVSPANAAVLTTPATANLSWTAAAGASSYDIYLWTGAVTPSTPIANVTGTSYNASGLAASSLYNWYIVPKNAGGPASGCAANASSFTTAVGIPACAVNISPANGANIAGVTTATVSWSAVNGASSYDVYIVTGPTPPGTATATVTSTSYNASGLSPATAYNWYVVPKNATGSATGCGTSNRSVFNTASGAGPACAVNTAPADGETIATQTEAALEWNAVPTATSYKVFLWTGASIPATPVAIVNEASYLAQTLSPATHYSWYVVPVNAAGDAAECQANNLTSFTTAAAAVTPPNCTSNTAPADNATVSGQTSASLSWATVGDASSYDVYIWTGATAPALPTANTTNTTYNATGLAAGTQYSWYIVPRNDGGPATGCAANATVFTTAAVPVPACAVNASPANNSNIGTQTTATLNWTDVANATSYDVFLWTGAVTPTTATATVTASAYNATGLVAGNLYNWYVVPKNASGSATGCATGNASSFTTASVGLPLCVTNTSPADAAVIGTQTTASLTWSSAAGATSYDVYIWTGATAPNTPVATVTTAFYNATGLVAGTGYTWYVVPKNESGPASGCGTNNETTFTTAALAPPVCATNTLPANNSTIATANTAALSWGAVAAATSYDVYIWTGATPPAVATANTTVASYNAINLLGATTYSWYVVPKNAGGAASGCDAGNKTIFTTATVVTPPVCAVNALPVNGAVIATQTTAALSWTAAAGATSYDVYVWTGANAPASPTANTGSTSYNAAGLTAGTLYNWYVTPKNSGGPATGCDLTNKTSFTTATALAVPVCATNTAPANATSIATQTTASLSWGTVANAASYDVYIWTGAVAPSSATANTSETSYNATGLTAATTYNWYVVPKNASGAASGCDVNNKTSFTTAAVALPVPGCVTNASPAAGATLASQTTATLSWPAASTATSYDVYLSAGAGTPTNLVTNTSALSYSASGLTAGTVYSWYIAPRNASGANTACASSNASSFTTAAAAVLPACIINTSPANASSLPSQTSVRLTWPASPGAVSYDVYLAAGNAVPTALATNTTALTYYVSTLTAGTLYSWYVAPRNANGANTACGASNRTTFTTAAATGGGNISPVANAGGNLSITLPVTTVTLNGGASYDPDGRISEYYWYQAQAPVTTSITNNFTVAPTMTGLTVAGTYVFGLQVKDNLNVPSYSSVTVTVNPAGTVTIPACVTNTSPAAGTTIATQTSATLTWPASAGAVSYDVYLAAGAGIPGTLVTNTTALTYTSNSLTAGTTYSWYIAPRNTAGVATTCAAANTTSFTTAAAAVTLPACVVNTSPVAGSTLATQTSVTLTWPSAANASSYDVYLSAGAGTPTTLVTNTTALTYTYNSLNAGTLYSWYIAPRNAAGAATGCAAGNTTSFTTAAPTVPLPACVVNTSPAAGSTLATQTSVTLTWPSSANATSYDVYLAAGTGTPATLVTNTAALTYTSNSLLAGTTYSWYIAPRNASGAATTCTATNTTTFTTAAATLPVPACVVNTAPANGSTIATQTTATLSWPAAATATSYDVYLAAGTGVPATLVTNTTALSYNASGLTAATTYSWYIAPRNASGAATGCGSSNRTSFTTAAAVTLPACVSNSSPANAAVLPTQTSARLNWTASPGATSYDVYLAAGNAVPAVLVTNTTALTYYATTLTAGTLYSWYIAPRNANGGNTSCGSSNRSTFTTAAATGGGNIAPVANAGSNMAISLPTTSVTLNGGASYDPDGRIAEFYWYQTGGPVTTSISNFVMNPTITGLTVAGVYGFGLQVKDNNGTPSWGSVTVTVNAAGNIAANDGNNLRTTASVAAASAVSADEISAVPAITSTVSPNPVKPGQSARVLISSDKTGTAVVNIVNTSGYVVTTQKVNLVPGTNTAVISTSSLGQGLYIINVSGGSKPVNIKLLVE